MQDDLRVAESKTQAVTADRDMLSDRSNELKAQIKALQKRAGTAEQDRDALLAQNAEAEMQLSALSKQAAEAEKETEKKDESSSRSWFRHAIVEEKAVTRARYDQMAADLADAQRDVADLKNHVVEITLKRVEEEDGRFAAVNELEDTVASLRRQLRAVKEEAMMMEEHISELQREKVALVAKNATCELLILSLEDKTSSTSLTPLQETPLRHKVVSLEARLKEFESLAVENGHFRAAIESIKQQMMASATAGVDLRALPAAASSPGGPQELSFTDDEPGSPNGAAPRAGRLSVGSIGSPPATPPSVQLADLRECGPVFGSGTFGRVRLVQERSTKAMYALKAMLKSEIVAHKVRRLSPAPFVASRLRHLLTPTNRATVNASTNINTNVNTANRTLRANRCPSSNSASPATKQRASREADTERGGTPIHRETLRHIPGPTETVHAARVRARR